MLQVYLSTTISTSSSLHQKDAVVAKRLCWGNNNNKKSTSYSKYFSENCSKKVMSVHPERHNPRRKDCRGRLKKYRKRKE